LANSTRTAKKGRISIGKYSVLGCRYTQYFITKRL
jgi:hypothetical protein